MCEQSGGGQHLQDTPGYRDNRGNLHSHLCRSHPDEDSKLIQYYRLSSVEAGLLAKAVNRLEEVVFFNTGLSQKQAEAILAERRVKTSLRKLNLNRCGLNEDWLTRIRLASGTFLVAEAHGDGEDDEGLEAGGGGGMLLRHSDTHTICFWLGGYI